MQIICISRGSQSLGKEFAEKLASKLGYACIGREDLLEEATRRKIPVGKLETAIIKPRIFSERLAHELEHYKALATCVLCEKALEKSVVYHGRTGHLLLPGIENIFKIRIVADWEYRIQYVMKKLDLPREKAKLYVERVEDDRRRWVKQFYNVDWDVFTLYDLILNLSEVNVDNASSAVCSMAQLPEFQATPATTMAMKNLYLTAKARLALFTDNNTRTLNAKVNVDSGKAYVIYPYQQADQAEHIAPVLEKLEGIREVVTTEAQTNILWIQESFESSDTAYGLISSLAQTWDAAVELIKFVPTEEPDEKPQQVEARPQDTDESWRETGIMDDSDEPAEEEESRDIAQIYEKLINSGKAGSKKVITGDQKALLGAIDRTVKYRLIILDKTYLKKEHSAQVRLQQELSNTITETVHVPTVDMKEIVSKYHIGGKQIFQMILFAVLTALMVFAIFHFDDQILAFLQKEGLEHRILAAACVFVFVPIYAYIYSNVTGLFLKMIKLD